MNQNSQDAVSLSVHISSDSNSINSPLVIEAISCIIVLATTASANFKACASDNTDRELARSIAAETMIAMSSRIHACANLVRDAKDDPQKIMIAAGYAYFRNVIASVGDLFGDSPLEFLPAHAVDFVCARFTINRVEQREESADSGEINKSNVAPCLSIDGDGIMEFALGFVVYADELLSRHDEPARAPA